jgi:putative ABC transport system substrate-binding protein
MSDPVRAKLIDSLARPGGNLTGLTSASPDVSAKRLQLMKELVPALARAAVHLRAPVLHDWQVFRVWF